MADFSEEHTGKRVVSQSGVEIGTVEDVRNGDLYVSVTTADTNETLDELNWNRMVNQDLHHLRQQYISNITDETIRLRV